MAEFDPSAETRTDAAGRVLNPWEVSPAKQVVAVEVTQEAAEAAAAAQPSEPAGDEQAESGATKSRFGRGPKAESA